MTTLKKFEYVVDSDHLLIRAARAFDTYLSTLCPVLVGGLRGIADRQISARLFLSMQSSAEVIRLGAMFEDAIGVLPEIISHDIAEAKLFLAVATSELAKRYSANTLEPELHTGGEASVKYAQQQVAQEPQEPVATESDGDWIDESGAGVSHVNSVADGIA